MTRRFLLFVLIIVPVCTWSQTYIGIRGGYSPISIISFKPSKNATSYYGEKPDFGLVFKHFNEKWFGFQGEVNFNHRGYNVPFQDTFQLRQVNSYIELPVFIQLHINLASVYLHVQAGCYAAYLLSAKQGVDTTGNMVLNNYQFDILRDNRFDYGLVGGGGLSREFTWGVIQIDIRILYGFGDLYKYKYAGNPDQSKAVVQNVSISYLYNLSKLGKKRKNENNP